jgi:hypothetical protein
MRTARLLSLSDQFIRQADLPTVLRTRRSPAFARAFFHTTRSHRIEPRPQRYGTAREPPPHLAEGEEGPLEDPNDSVIEMPEAEQVKALPAPPLEEPKPPPTSEAAAPPEPEALKTPSLERVLDMTPPTQEEASKAPHLQAPKYIHHFDTWSLVKDLQTSGFTHIQSVTVMKAVRGLLAENMELARSALVSKSNVENVCCTRR